MGELCYWIKNCLTEFQTNCGHEFFPDEALSQAKYLDDYFQKYGKPIGPLHGLPISLKDQLRIKVGH